MSLLANKSETKTKVMKTTVKGVRDKFLLGESECHFETAVSFAGKLDALAVKRMFKHKDIAIHPTEGKSLKVLLTIYHPVVNEETSEEELVPEIRFVGFITQADASAPDLGEVDIPGIVKHINDGHIVKATNIDEMVDMF